MGQTEYKILKDLFRKKGINADQPVFLDEENFRKAEKADPNLLDNYGRYVFWQSYNSAYLEREEKIIRIASKGIQESLLAEKEEDRKGKCLHTCMALSQILDLHKVWNFVVSGAVYIKFPKNSGFKPFHFNIVGPDEQKGSEYGHKWIFAPPFKVIDFTVKLQDYDENFVELLPEMVMTKKLKKARTVPQDLICETILKDERLKSFKRSEIVDKLVPLRKRQFMKDCPPGIVEIEGLTMKYIPTTTGGSDGSLQQLASYSKNGEKLEFPMNSGRAG